MTLLLNNSLKNIISEFFDLEEIDLPNWLKSSIQNESLILNSYLWKSDKINKIRLSELKIKDKFQAQSLVIYPHYQLNAPIFGTEYLHIANKKYFGAVDFHPIIPSQNNSIYLEMFSDVRFKKSKFYDLDKFFSNKLWIRKENVDFYNQYQIIVKCYLHQYKKLLSDSELSAVCFKKYQKDYNQFMSCNDPAFGILKCYFGMDFAKKYIHSFLFD